MCLRSYVSIYVGHYAPVKISISRSSPLDTGFSPPFPPSHLEMFRVFKLGYDGNVYVAFMLGLWLKCSDLGIGKLLCPEDSDGKCGDVILIGVGNNIRS